MHSDWVDILILIIRYDIGAEFMASANYCNEGQSVMAQVLSTVGIEANTTSTTSSESRDDSNTDDSDNGGIIHGDFVQELMSNIPKNSDF